MQPSGLITERKQTINVTLSAWQFYSDRIAKNINNASAIIPTTDCLQKIPSVSLPAWSHQMAYDSSALLNCCIFVKCVCFLKGVL